MPGWFIPKWFDLEATPVLITRVDCPQIDLEIDQQEVCVSLEELSLTVDLADAQQVDIDQIGIEISIDQLGVEIELSND